MRKMKKKRFIMGITAVTVAVAVIVAACAVYLNDYYHADDEAIAGFELMEQTPVQIREDGTLVYAPENADTGLIFYPGGKVEYTAYAPLMAACAAEGILCVLVEMPFNLAVLDVDAAAGIQELYPEIANWYIGGHSLGGSMAASYLSETPEDFTGLVLLGSYSTADLSAASTEVLSVYGSEDKVLNQEKYVENQSNLPADFTELIIDGGCHAYFGMYGVQEGDGMPDITNEEQIVRTVKAIVEFMAE